MRHAAFWIAVAVLSLLSGGLATPRSSFTLHRHMVLWHVTSYRDGLRLEYDRMLAISRLQEAHGRWLWQWKAPLRERLALRMAPAEIALSSDAPAALTPATAAEPTPAAPSPAAVPETTTSPEAQSVPSAPKVTPPLAVLAFLPNKHAVEIDPPAALPTQLNERDRQLVQAASAILRTAEDKGDSVSQMALARGLRAQGHAIANERLGWLIQAAGERPPPDGHQQHRGTHDTHKPATDQAPRHPQAPGHGAPTRAST